MNTTISKKHLKIPMNMIFHPHLNEYYILYSYKSNKILSTYIKKEQITNDPILKIKSRLEKINFTGLNSLIEFCKNEKLSSLLLVLEWVNFFIYKEERKLFSNKSDNNYVLGINRFTDFIDDSEEIHSKNDYTYYSSQSRNLILNLLIQMIISTEMLVTNDFESFINKFTLQILILNYDEAIRLIKETLALNSKKLANDIIPFLIIFQEILKHFTFSSNSNYDNLNETVKTILVTSLDKMEINPLIFYIIMFFQQKFNNIKLNEFLTNRNISILLKLIYIFKHEPKENILIHLETLEDYYMSIGGLEGLIITGNSNKTINLLKNYLDNTDDLLVTVILSKFFIENKKYSKDIELYLFETMNQLNMFNERILITQKLNEIISYIEKKERKILNHSEWVLSCFYCGIKIQSEKADQFRYMFVNNREQTECIDFCPKCIKKLPACAICLCPIEINISNYKNKILNTHTGVDLRKESKIIDDEKEPDLKYVWCTKCRHGGHLDHIKEWFSELMICSVADCNCICLEYNHILI